MAERGPQKPVRNDEQAFTFRNVQLFKNETLGTGSYGAVCKAKCDQLICAAKLLYPVLFRMLAPDLDKKHRLPFHRFEKECRFLSRVNHPNIVQYLGTYRDPDTNAPVLLMELMDESLTHFLESSPGDIPYHIQVNLSQDIAQALAFLHANGIIHRDLSSNNVLLIAGSRAKVTDFGMLKFIDVNAIRLATMTLCPGTPVFMSPEALDEPPVYTEKLDNFSFGVLLVQIITQQFPEPGDRFDTVLIPSPRNPALKVKTRLPVPEAERRHAHISLIDPTHPLLPVALECLKDEAVERPSSQELCQSLDALKKAIKYKGRFQQDEGALLKEKWVQIQGKLQDFQALHQERQSLQNYIKAKDHQLRKLQQQLKSNEEITATLQQTIAQRDREIYELRKLTASQTSYCGGHIAQLQDTSDSKQLIHLSWPWETIPTAPVTSFEHMSAVVGEKAYFKSARSVWEFNSTSQQWNQLPEHPLWGFSLVSVENELVTVGGFYPNKFGAMKFSDKLYNFEEGKWVEKYPPMPTKRWECATFYRNPELIVLGGAQGYDLTCVEVLNIYSKQWCRVRPLPSPSHQLSVTVCGDYMYIHDAQPESNFSLVRCSLLSLVVYWEKIASLPVRTSTLVTVNGHLLAMGGKTTKNVDTKRIHQYDPDTDSWQIVSPMKTERSRCAAALLHDNKLMVVGGGFKKPSEVASVL